MSIGELKIKIFKNSFWLGLGEGILHLFMFFLLVFAARILGPTNFGIFSFALAFVSIFLIFSNFGLSDITTRELAKNRRNEQEYSAIISLKILLSILAFALIIITSFFITQDEETRKIIWILGVYVLANNFLVIIYSFFRARQQMKYEAAIRILQAMMIIGLGFFVLFRIPLVETLSYALLVATSITIILTLIFFSIFIKPIRIIWAPNLWKKFLKLSWPIGLASAFAVIYIYIDSVMMGFWGQITEVGWYNAAYKIIAALIIPGALIGTSFYPVLSKLFKESKEKLQKVWNCYIELMIILAIPLVVGGIALAPKIINFFYNPSFSPSVLAFQILAIMAGTIFLFEPSYLILITSNQQKKIFWITLFGAIINIILNLILIPRYSLYGAAVATVITYIILLFLVIEFSRRFTPISPFNLRLLKILIIAFLSSSIMFIAISQSLIYNLNVILTAIIGILIYFTTLFLFYKFLWRKKKQKPFLFRE